MSPWSFSNGSSTRNIDSSTYTEAEARQGCMLTVVGGVLSLKPHRNFFPSFSRAVISEPPPAEPSQATGLAKASGPFRPHHCLKAKSKCHVD